MPDLFDPSRLEPAPPAVATGRDRTRRGTGRGRSSSRGRCRGGGGTASIVTPGVWCVPLSPNKDATKLLLSELVKKVENEKLGIRDPFEKHRKKALSEHLEDWLASLRANGRGTSYVALKASRVRAAIEYCGWALPGDMTADRLETFLAALSQPRNQFFPAARRRRVVHRPRGGRRTRRRHAAPRHLPDPREQADRSRPREGPALLAGHRRETTSAERPRALVTDVEPLPASGPPVRGGWRTTAASTAVRSPV